MNTDLVAKVTTTAPHVIPYQGSKRKLAARIAHYFPASCKTFYEPFAGSAAMSIFTAQNHLANRFVIGDVLEPLVELLEMTIERPDKVADGYERIWKAQGDTPAARYDYFFSIRHRYNAERDPILLLFLIARCVANAIRFGGNGNFTQSPDKRRKGTLPDKMRKSIRGVSALLKGKCTFFVGDFAECVASASPLDLIYFDPPYRGTTEGADKRYFKQVETERLLHCLERLNERGVPFIVSYDGSHGEKSYGEDLPDHLNCEKFSLHAGRSTQGTLNGKAVHTTESLYVSKLLLPRKRGQLSLALA
jgi:DNA adenine methylase